VRPLTIVSTGQREIPTEAKTLVLKGAEVILPLAGMLDLDAERQRLEREMESIEIEIARLEARLKDEKFLSRAPANIIAKEKERLASNRDKMERLKQKIAELG
jgi:valyl-tRNA synthetase